MVVSIYYETVSLKINGKKSWISECHMYATESISIEAKKCFLHNVNHTGWKINFVSIMEKSFEATNSRGKGKRKRRRICLTSKLSAFTIGFEIMVLKLCLKCLIMKYVFCTFIDRWIMLMVQRRIKEIPDIDTF